MPEITLTDQPRLDRRQFIEQLLTAEEDYDPVEELLAMQRDLIELEQKHGMTSSEFSRRYCAGEMGDAVEIVYWVGLHRQYSALKSLVTSPHHLRSK